MKFKYLALFTIPFVGLSLSLKPSVGNVFAQDFVASDWTLVAPNGTDPWTQKEGESLINTNSVWFPANFLMNNNTTGLNRTDDGRLSYQVKTKFQSSHTLDDLQSAQWRGVVLFYLNDSNWLSASTKWDKGQTGGRADKIEMSEFMVYGRINGNFYQTPSGSSWISNEWNDLWADGNQIHITDEVELTVQFTPALDGTAINETTDMVTLAATDGTHSSSKTQRLRSLSDDSYFDLDSNINNMSTGLYSMNVDHKIDDSVTFSQFEYSPIKPIFGDYEKIDEGFVNASITLPNVTAHSVVQESIATSVSVKDPDNIDVVVTANKFTPTKIGDYTVTYKAIDKFNTSATDSYTIDVHDGYLILPSSGPTVSGVLGDTITVPTFYVDGHPEIPISVSVTDPNGNNVALSDNKFVANIGGDYVVNATTSSPNVAPFSYVVSIKGTYSISEEGTRVVSGTLGDKITIPKYFVEDHDEIEITTTVSDPNDNVITLYNNSFSATKVGNYKVNVKAVPGNYIIQDIDYDIVINDIPNEDDDGEDTPPADPNTNNYGYGTRSVGIYFLLGGIALGVSALSVGGFFLARFLINLKKKGE